VTLGPYRRESVNDKTMTAAYTIDRGGNLVSQRRSGATYYHHYDALGSTRLATDADQTTAASYVYDAFGNLRSQSGALTNPHQYVGRLGYFTAPGDSGLLFLRARYYSPSHGRFWTSDPAREAHPGFDYAGNSPATATDPSGLWGAADHGKMTRHVAASITFKGPPFPQCPSGLYRLSAKVIDELVAGNEEIDDWRKEWAAFTIYQWRLWNEAAWGWHFDWPYGGADDRELALRRQGALASSHLKGPRHRFERRRTNWDEVFIHFRTCTRTWI